jgi:hypothetical protein
MSPSRTFILRPIATTLFMAAILLGGYVGYQQLPISALPEVDYPTMQIVTFYPGASPEVMATSVTAPLERQFGQVPGLQQMTSTSSDGSSVITLQFNLSLNIDIAEQEVQEAINASGSYLPADLPNPPIYSKTNPADAPIMTLALTSDTLPLSKIEDLADTRLAQKISQVSGVGLVTINGGQKPAVRIQANPTALSAYGINLEDIRTAISSANVNQAKGSFDGPQQAFQIGANDQLLDSSEYASLVIAYRNGAPVKLSDVAAVKDSVENTEQAAWANTTPAIILNIERQPGANIIQVVDSITKLLPKLRQSLPPSVNITTLSDRTNTIRASVSDVEFELGLSVVLVVLVIFLFLHLDRLRRRRRDRDDRKYIPLHRGGREAARGRAEGRGPDRVHHRRADHLAHRGADPAPFHERHRRPALPRVRHHAHLHHPDLGPRFADADADARGADASREGEPAPQSLLPTLGGRLQRHHQFLRRDVEVRPPRAAARAARRTRHAGADHPPLHRDSQGPVSGPGHG